ncbi:MAG: hypothetical protein J0I00_17670 [Burkholderiales bacterium]|nr:hypothetical protein [Burkholderiales bacterium]
MTERAPKPYTAPDGKTRLARGPSEHAAAIESAGANIADALRTLPSADSWESLRLAVKHHGQGTEAAGEAMARSLDSLAEAIAGAGDAQSEALSEFLAPAVDHLGNQAAAAADKQAEALRDVGSAILAGLQRIAAALESRPA